MNLSELRREDAEKILREKFSLPRFHDGQWEAISRVLRGEKLLLIEKTGYGKSLCFQFPAILFDGLTIVFSPLIALMRDQVTKLQKLGVAAESINSHKTQEQNKGLIADAKAGKIKILYIAPERQENMSWLEEVRNLNLSMVVVDEAHCISVWGHDFRPAYRRIVDLVNLLPEGMPVLATTATATKRVEMDIAKQMAGKLKVIRGNLIRENFNLYVVDVKSDNEKLIWLAQNVQDLEGTGIIYTGTVAETRLVAKWFYHLGISSNHYHSRIDAETRINVEHGLLENRWKCVISTNALGMGIDKPDLRFIIHTQFPQSPVHYYQEIGRAGRDDLPTKIILLYNPEDRDLPEAFIEGAKPPTDRYHGVIKAIKEELLGERELMKRCNLSQTQIRVILTDLIDQKIVRKINIDGLKKYEYILSAPEFKPDFYDEVRKAKTREMEAMMAYAETQESRMAYLCDYLGDSTMRSYSNCDNTGLAKCRVEINDFWINKLEYFHQNNFPELEVESSKTNMINGVAASFYGVSNVGSIIHRCKYENGGYFPDFLISLLLKAYKLKFKNERFDFILYVPPTVSGNLVENLAERVSKALGIPLFHSLIKTRTTSKQKVFKNNVLKKENVADAFAILNPENVKDRSILLIDDIYDSGATIKEIGSYLTTLGAKMVAPIVLAKTVAGDKL